MKIFKYVVSIEDAITRISLSKDAKILHVDQADEPSAVWFWATYDDTHETEERRFCIHGTGHGVSEDDHVYVGTVPYPVLGLVWHLFEQVGAEING